MYRVLSAQLAHETNTFSVKTTTLDDFRSRALYLGDDIAKTFSGTNTEIGAHLDAADLFGWQLVQPLACSATPSGPTTASAWSYLHDTIVGAAASTRFDGAILALHGAMVTEDEDDAEGALLKSLRKCLGANVPIIVTVDLHANISERMAENCDGLLAYRTYPHIDQYDVAFEACRLLQSSMKTDTRHTVTVWRLPTLRGCDFGRTGGTTMPGLLRLCRDAKERDSKCEALEICAGFPWADVPFAGPTVVMTSRGSPPENSPAVDRILKEIWDSREVTSAESCSVEAAVALAKAWDGAQPLVMADVGDNPGAGGYGDQVCLLEALIEGGVDRVAVAAIADPKAAAAAIAAGVGSTLPLKLGGLFEPGKYGGPMSCTAVVEAVFGGALKLTGPMLNGLEVSLGPTAVLKIGRVTVVVASNNMQVFDRSFFNAFGIDPLAMRVLVVKSSHHFRSDFERIAGRILLVDAGGPVSPDLACLKYEKLRRPIEPLDAVDDPWARS